MLLLEFFLFIKEKNDGKRDDLATKKIKEANQAQCKCRSYNDNEGSC